MTLRYCLGYNPHASTSLGTRTVYVSILIFQSLGTIGVGGIFMLIGNKLWSGTAKSRSLLYVTNKTMY